VFADFAVPLAATVAGAVGIGVLLQIWGTLFVVAQNDAAVFRATTAVGVVIRRRRLAVVPQDLTRRFFDDLSKPWSDAV